MVLKNVSEPKYVIERKGYDGFVFSASSPNFLFLPDAVKFASERGGILQSASEAGAFRIEAGGQDNADGYQATRTVAVYFKEGDKFYVAFDDVADSVQNIILARASEGFDSHKKFGKWLLPKNDKHIEGLLKRAEDGRIRELAEMNRLELSLEQIDGVSEFGNALTPILCDVAEPYADFLRNVKKYTKGFLYGLTIKTVEGFKVGDDKVEVRAVGLGGSNYFGVDADVRFSLNGSARSVVHAL